MKLFSSLSLALTLFLAASASAVDWIPASTAYIAPNPDGAEVSEKEGAIRWKDTTQSISWYGQIKQASTIRASVVLKLPAGAVSKLRLTVAGKSHEATATADPNQPLLEVDFGEFEVKEPGYQQFKLESLNAQNQPPGELRALYLTGLDQDQAHFNMLPRRNAASVHLAYPTSKDDKIEWFYNEVTAVDDPEHTFYMACGFHRGYFGMQVNSPTERRIIFSVWDAGNGLNAKDRSKLSQENFVSLVAKGKDVHTEVFGNEGTGGHSHLTYNWKTGDPQRFLLTAQPAEKTFTIYSGYYFHPEEKAWMLISSMKAPKDGGYLHGLYSFSENFGGSTGNLRRKALFGNQWIRTSDGAWHEILKATFSHDATGKKDRLDRFMGIENNQFFLSHGGFVPGFNQFGDPFTRTASEKHPEITLPKITPLP